MKELPLFNKFLFALYPMKTLTCYLIVLLTLTSCIEKSLEIDLKESPTNQLSVLAVLRNNLPFTALVSAIVPLNPNPLDYRVKNATVTLFENNSEIARLTFDTIDQNQDRAVTSAFYTMKDTLRLLEGAMYHIEVTSPGYESLESEGVSFDRVFSDNFRALSEYTLSSEGVLLRTLGYEFSIIDTVTMGEYLSEEDRLGQREERLNQYILRNRFPFLIFNGRNVAGTNLRGGTYLRGERYPCLDQINCNPSAITENVVCFTIYHLTEHYLNFAIPYSNQERENIGNIGTDVSILPNNLKGGIGYFTVIDSQNGCAVTR